MNTSPELTSVNSRGGTVHRCHGSVRTSVQGVTVRCDFGTNMKKRNLCSVSFHLF